MKLKKFSHTGGIEGRRARALKRLEKILYLLIPIKH